MKIYRKKITPIAESIVDTMVRDGDIEIFGSLHNVVVKDIAGFIENYSIVEKGIDKKLKELLPISSFASQVSLLEYQNSSWQQRKSFKLGTR